MRQTEAFPYIWAGARVPSSDVLPSDDPDHYDTAIHIRLNDRVSTDERYWEGRTDALKEFDYWYQRTGIAQKPKTVQCYLAQCIGRGEVQQEVGYGAWIVAAKRVPPDRKIVLAQVYDLTGNETAQTFAYRIEGQWYIATSSNQVLPEKPDESCRIAVNAKHPRMVQAWMEPVPEYRAHSK